uniref:Uncharacterized protein n=1 Tax=viral metagenome TaxID=1070528 RepID=A0A6C0CYQ8_9ZZZZ
MRDTINILLIVIIIQYIIIEFMGVNTFNIFSFIKNTIFVMIFLSIFAKQKKNRRVNNKYSLLLIIPIIYLMQYLYYPVYVGQDIAALPVTIIGHFATNLQKLQNENIYNILLNDARIDLNDTKINFWYEYQHFFVDNKQYCIIINRPGKYDDFLRFTMTYLDIITGDKKEFDNIIIHKNEFKYYIKGNDFISEINNNKLGYKVVLNIKNRKKKVYIKTDNINIYIDGYITTRDNYCSCAILKQYLPNFNKWFKMGGISDIYPYEYINDTYVISNSDITINGVLTKNCISWFDVYSGTDYHYMTNYIWFMNYSENWNIFILFYTDYPYDTGKRPLVVSFFYNKKLDKMIECSNFYINSNFNSMATGINTEVELLDNTNLTTDTIKYKLTYTTPKIKCYIKSKKIYKACDNNKFYTRISKDKDYGEAEDIQSVMEQLRYDEFGGRSDIYIEYDNKIYKEESLTTIDGLSWENGNTPIGYKQRNEPFFDKIFYVKHPNRDKLNGKIDHV